jgi:hypothetical protein
VTSSKNYSVGRSLRNLVEVTWQSNGGDPLATIETLQSRYGFGLMQAAGAVGKFKNVQLEIKHDDGSVTQFSN